MLRAFLSELKRRAAKFRPVWHAPSLLGELTFAALVLVTAMPLWVVRYPPIQDLPQHLAAIRVIHDYTDPSLRFAEYFELALGSTQYLGYYLTAHVLAFVTGVPLANKLIMTAAVVGTPYALRSLLRALGRDDTPALFVLPLTYNAHLILGFVNFIAAIPLGLWAIALAVKQRQAPTRRRAILLALVLVFGFYMHVVPFTFGALGVALVGFGDGLRPTLRRYAPLLPAAVAALIWSRESPAGRSFMAAAGVSETDGRRAPQFVPWSEAMRDVASWLTDVLQGEHDNRLLYAWFIALLTAFVLGADARNRDVAQGSRPVTLGLTRRVGLLAPIAAAAYVLTPASYDWIWPINARFPLLALIFALVALPRLTPMPRYAIATGVAVITLLSVQRVATAFQTFEREEVGDLDQALSVIPEGRTVAGLIWDRGSRVVKFSPFIHAVAYYQARKGGAVMFTFADFPHSPFRFVEAKRPPRVPPRWEWLPDRVDPARDLAFYEYVITRGGPGRLARQSGYERIYDGERWSVWKRTGSGRSGPSASE